MGDGDRTDPTTDFFDTHRAQCAKAARLLRSVPDAAALVSELDKAVAACDAAIAGGRLRADMPAVVSAMPVILTKYAATAAKTKGDLDTAKRAEDPSPPDGSAKATVDAAPE